MRRRSVTQRAFQPAAASHLLPARAPTAPHLAQHTSHATLCAPLFARSTSHAARSTHHARNTTNARAPRRGGPFSPPPPHTRLRLARQPHLSVRNTARAQRATHTTWRAVRSHTRAHTKERSDAPRAARSQPTASSHSLPTRAPTAPHNSHNNTHQLIARLLLFARAHTQACATRHARTTWRASLHTPHTHSARQALRRARQAPTRRDSRAPSPQSHDARSGRRPKRRHATRELAHHATHAPHCAPRSAHRTRTALTKRPTALAKRTRAETHEPTSPQSHARRGGVVKQSPPKGGGIALRRFSHGTAL